MTSCLMSTLANRELALFWHLIPPKIDEHAGWKHRLVGSLHFYFDSCANGWNSTTTTTKIKKSIRSSSTEGTADHGVLRLRTNGGALF
uniref:Uncharacterized protein n=1 Tax=Caenorhabditis japonica TaxID=281687 RepID=A0A8R1EJM6_CAEJA